MTITETLRNAITPVSKAVAAFVTPFVLLAISWLIEATGVDIPHDPGAIETFVLSIVSAALVWAVRNTPKGSQ